MPISVRNNRHHTASRVACVAAIYSASTDDSATVGCLRDCQLTAPPCSRNTQPVHERRSIVSLPQSESLKPYSGRWLSAPLPYSSSWS